MDALKTSALVSLPDSLDKAGPRGLQLPLSLYLSPSILPAAAATLHELIRRQPGYARVVDKQDGALHVLPDFELEEVAALERRCCRVIGLPFAERILRDPSALGRVHALPLYDVIYRADGAICCSGLPPAVRVRCNALARWMGARFSEGLAQGVGLLVTSRVSLHPESKYQAALKQRLPVVRPSYLEEMWQAKDDVDMEAHVLPPLSGLGICFDPRQADVIERFRDKVASHGAVIESLDRAEVVIVKDVFAPLYQEARKMGILVAPPLWLERCLQLRHCVLIVGELEVLNPKSASLMLSGALVPSLGVSKLTPTIEAECGMCLTDCVCCLLYLPLGHQRDAAKALAWKCGAFTTLNPLDKAITHVLFKVVGKQQTQVSVPIDEDRVSFLDVSWLEACAQEGRRVREELHPQQHVVFNPSCDTAYACAFGRTTSSNNAGSAQGADRSSLLGANTKALVTEVVPPLVQPRAIAEQRRSSVAGVAPGATTMVASADRAGGRLQLLPPVRSLPLAEHGVFAGLVLGLIGWKCGDADEVALVEKIRGQGGTVVHGGSAPEVVLEANVDVCVCKDFGPPPLTASRVSVALATVFWVNACLADGVCHPRSGFPHFEPGPGPLPLQAMSGCSIRITALEASSHRRRLRLEELANVLGAQVAQQDSRWANITHVVCVLPELLDTRLFEGATKRAKPVVTVQWLFDCFRTNSRQAEDRYAVSSTVGSPSVAAGPAGLTAESFAAKVLAGHDVLISPSALGSDPQLPQMAEELGATVHTWRSVDELMSLLEVRGILLVPPGTTAGATHAAEANGDVRSGSATSESTSRRHQTIVLLETEEVSEAGAPLAVVASAIAHESRDMFVLPTWLSETYRQQRRSPIEAFAALPAIDSEELAPKRQRLDEATYAWQPEQMKRLEELAEHSKKRAMESKVQQKVNEGLRLAELRQGPSRLGG